MRAVAVTIFGAGLVAVGIVAIGIGDPLWNEDDRGSSKLVAPQVE
jgi:hypothetical protein